MDAVKKAEFDAAMEDMEDKVIEMDDDMDSKANLIAEGNFKEKAHHVEGKALLIDDNGKKVEYKKTLAVEIFWPLNLTPVPFWVDIVQCNCEGDKATGR